MNTEDYLDRRLTQDPSFVTRRIAGELILVPIQQQAGSVASIYPLNELARFIWELVDGEKRVRDIRDAIVDEFEVEPEEAETDLVEFLQRLEYVGALRAI